ncbi:MAG: hypothetical protein GF346_07725 [Candidatus Eisenbacteria bacterium]|nr:hypothetical protein [Candidatus Latescibacterota bacterium]MBD3302321.1 hypothetical protein [Candidatus Eisenbacteria bacterium]
MNRLRAGLFALLLGGCGYGTTDLEEIAVDPFRFQARSVTVRGTVARSDSLPAVGRNGIELAQADARLLVLTRRERPAPGSVLKVSGHVEADFDLGDRRAPVLIDEDPGPKRNGGRTDVR